MLQGTRLAAQLIPGSPVFIPTFLTSSNWTTVTGGQRVENIKQAGDVVVFVSGEGNRCTLLKPAVCDWNKRMRDLANKSIGFDVYWRCDSDH